MSLALASNSSNPSFHSILDVALTERNFLGVASEYQVTYMTFWTYLEADAVGRLSFSTTGIDPIYVQFRVEKKGLRM